VESGATGIDAFCIPDWLKGRLKFSYKPWRGVLDFGGSIARSFLRIRTYAQDLNGWREAEGMSRLGPLEIL
jgi:hypothetical protein